MDVNDDAPVHLEPLRAELFALRFPMLLASMGTLGSLVLSILAAALAYGVESLAWTGMYALATGLPTLLLLASTAMSFAGRDAPDRLVLATNLQVGMWWLVVLTGGGLSLTVCGFSAMGVLLVLGM